MNDPTRQASPLTCTIPVSQNSLRIVSFLPAATEMVGILGLLENLVGISHECNYPPGARGKPVLVRCSVDLRDMSMQEIDRMVTRMLGEGKSLFQIDEEALRAAAPDLIVSQELCKICASSGNELIHVLKSLPNKPRIIWQSPKSFNDVLREIMILAEEAGVPERGAQWVREAYARIDRITRITSKLQARPRVFFLEWVDPIYCGGHWIPRMIEWAGGQDSISRNGTDSVRIPWEDVARWDPEVLVISPCGFDCRQALKQAEQVKLLPCWANLSAVRNHRVYAVDGQSYYARPGPRLVDGVELLAHLIHPEEFDWKGPLDAFARVE